MAPEICLIAALSEDRLIGNKNKLLWRISADLKRFRELTVGHPIIMGRKTFDSIGRALPGRVNIVVTRDEEFTAPGCVVCHSLEDALAVAEAQDEKVFVIGGGEIFQQVIDVADRLYLTVVEGQFEGDTCFPRYSQFRVISEAVEESEGYRYKFVELSK